jgi:hypothetical protein
MALIVRCSECLSLFIPDVYDDGLLTVSAWWIHPRGR